MTKRPVSHRGYAQVTFNKTYKKRWKSMDFPGKRTKQRWIFHDVVGLLKGIIQIIEELGSQKLEPHAIPWFQI